MTVYLVGAGPGDPGLITARGRDLLAAADVVVFDRLASPELLAAAPPGATLIDVGKAPGDVTATQEEINAVLVDEGRTGRCVVRLKGGDPFLFGRGGEEAQALRAAGVAFEIVPGVTSALAAPAYAGIPVTHRGVSTHVTIVTGHEDPEKGATEVDWRALAAAGGTLVVLMGAGNLAEIASLLMQGGRAPETPVAAVTWGTTAQQQTTRATLATVAEAGVRSPSAIVIGEVASLDLAWFERRPLFGRSVVVTRAREQASDLSAALAVLGAEVVELPAISIEPLDFAVPDLGSIEWLVFTSVNGVDGFFRRGLTPAGFDSRALAGVAVAAIGPGTAAELGRHGVVADLVPERFVAEALLEVFPAPAPAPARGGRVVIPRAATARDVLPQGLERLGYAVDVLPVYETVTGVPEAAALDRVRDGGVDVITFTSSSTVTNLTGLLGSIPSPQPSVVAIGPVTAAAAREQGWRVDVEAGRHTIDGVVESVLGVFAD